MKKSPISLGIFYLSLRLRIFDIDDFISLIYSKPAFAPNFPSLYTHYVPDHYSKVHGAFGMQLMFSSRHPFLL